MGLYNFESGVLPSGWTQSSGSSAAWAVVGTGAYEGTYCIKAGTITHNQNSAIQCTVTTLAGNVTFWYKVSSEPTYDMLRFYVDGAEDTSFRKSGTVAWTQYTKAVTAGSHTFKWSYTKDISGNVGSDTAWLDIVFIPEPYLIPAAALDLTPQAPFWLPALIPAAALDLTPQAPFWLPALIPAAALDLTPQAPWLQFSAPVPAAVLDLTPANPTIYNRLLIPSAALTLTVQPPNFTYDPAMGLSGRYVYRCYLTGDDEDPPIDDIELPLASFQSTRRNGEQSYLAVVVPGPVPYIDAINARLNGDIVINSGFNIGGIEMLTELLRVNFESFRYDLGPRSGTAQLTGHKQVTYSNAKTRTLFGISYLNVIDGVKLVRCEPDMWLNPGDTADLGDSTVVVDSINYAVSPTFAQMEVKEFSE